MGGSGQGVTSATETQHSRGQRRAEEPEDEDTPAVAPITRRDALNWSETYPGIIRDRALRKKPYGDAFCFLTANSLKKRVQGEKPVTSSTCGFPCETSTTVGFYLFFSIS